jgi:hypothetical protein
MSKKDQTDIHFKLPLANKDNDKKQILEGKKKLLEIYVIASGLIIASTQSTISLIAINTSANASDYYTTISTTKTIITDSNICFFFLLIFLMIYYTGMLDKILGFVLIYSICISIFFSNILTNFLILNSCLPSWSYGIMHFALFIAIMLSLLDIRFIMEKITKMQNK